VQPSGDRPAKKCIEPLANRIGLRDLRELAKPVGVYEIFSMGGRTEYDWVKDFFYATDLPSA